MRHSPQRTRFRICCVAIGLFLFIQVPHAPSSGKLDTQILSRTLEIKRLLREKKSTQRLIEELKKRKWRVREVLEVINESVKDNQRKLNKIIRKINLLERETRVTSARISTLRNQINADRERLNSQLLALLYVNKVRQMTSFIGLNSFKHYFRNQYLLKKNSEIEADTLRRIDVNIKELEKKRETQRQQKLLLSHYKIEKEDQKNLLNFEQQQQLTYLNHIREDHSLRIRYLSEIQVELERLNSVVFSLEKNKKNKIKSKEFRGLRGKRGALPSPVKGKLVYRFEEKRSPFFTLYKRGILVETQENADVKSILSGTVVFSQPFRGYQNLVILDHGKGSLSVYGNLDEVFVINGDVIDQNYTLGTVAYNEMEKRYLFYFETRHNRRAVDPEQWLKKPAWR